MSIEVTNLQKWYGANQALNDISFSIKKGEIVGFLGPNGAGKTTTMKILTCLMPPTEGSATVCGLDVRKSPIGIQRLIGYLPENNPLYGDMFVQEYLNFVSQIYQIPDRQQRIADIIQQTGLVSHAHKLIKELSKGYRQRVGLAQALIHDPQVLILDEPTTGLDPNQIQEIREIIRRQGKTILLSTHIMQEVEAMCDRVIIIHQGKIIADNTTEELKRKVHAQERIIVEFDRPITPDEMNTNKIFQEVDMIQGNRLSLRSKDQEDPRIHLFDFAVSNKLRILEMYKEHNSLEDVFRELTHA
ncbi:MAG: ATP-binding cassette domain-containing protein [Saprospiraceae bacterium]|nr:ATP-binding cassette domain-containing protein [Saprospiraceae bacterium]